MMADLKPLIAELEAAKGGSRELSDRVLLAVGWTTSDSKDTRARFWRSPEGEDYDWWDDPHARSRGGPPLKRPSPTESLDDALTLVPKNCGWHVDYDGEACIFRLEKGKGQAGWPIIGECDNSKRHYEPAHALCIAALKARDAS